MSDFSFERELDVRWGDFDSLGHVNHAAYATYCEHVRLKYLETVLGVSLDQLSTGEEGFSMVIANLEIDYRYPISEPETVTVAMGVTDLGSSSIVMEYELRAEGELAATVETTLVAIDPETGSSMPLREEWIEAIETQEGTTF
jgi:acyl-CoA thioester hydrolase